MAREIFTDEVVDMKRSFVHVYTGNGKGKTTTALGLSVRTALSGKKVFFAQFVKGMEYSELKVSQYIKNIEIRQFGRECFIYEQPTEEDIQAANEGMDVCEKILKDVEYDLVVLDELNIALYYKLIPLERAVKAVKERTPSIEVAITGRYAPEEIIGTADLVTEMKEIKHYYNQGVQARKGIEF